ncbi:MAG: MoaD/ThiS family protein [Deltaproteobacteria bacterium]|jgi:molybdopterin synthase sulfur carrier subunit|nr:MoaD/ThiS family protein [Deltaproteobacteria bacterium]
MAVIVRIPTPLRKFTAGQEQVDIEATTIRGLLDGLESAHPGIRERLCDADGKVRRFVNIFVNGEDIRFASSLETSLKSGDDVSIVPAIAGGV